MRTSRAKNRATSRYASVIEHLESRFLLSGAEDLIADTQFTIDPPQGILTADQPPIVGKIDDATDRDVFAFTAQANGTVVVQQTAAPVSGGTLPFDGVLQVFNEGSDFAFASDFGSFDTTIPRVVAFPAIEGQVYFVDVTGYAGSVGNYQLTLASTPEVADTVGDTIESATDLGILTPGQPLEFSSSIGAAFDLDVFQFQTESSGEVFIDLSSPLSYLESSVALLDFSGHTLASSTDFGSSSGSRLTFTIQEGESYFVQVGGLSTSTGNYVLNLSFLTDDFGDTLFDATDLGVLALGESLEIAGTIETILDADVFRIDAAAGSELTFSTTSPVYADLFVLSADNSSHFFYSGQRVLIAEGDEVFLEVFPNFFASTPSGYEITVESVISDGRHESPDTAARTDDRVGDDSEEITQDGNSLVITGQLETAQDLDFFTFVAPFTGSLTISAPSDTGGANSESLQFSIDFFESYFDFGPYLIAQDPDAALARTTDGFNVFVYEGTSYFVSVTNQGDTTGAYELDLAPRAIPADDFPGFIDDVTDPFLLATPTATVTGQITNDFFSLDFDVIQVEAPADSVLSISSKTPDVFVNVIVRSPNLDGGFNFQSFFVNSFVSQRISVAADDDVFLEVSSYFDTAYQVTLQTVITDGRHDSFDTAARTDDPVADDSEEITQDGDSFQITGQLETTGDQDFFTFVAPTTGFLTISAPSDIAGVNSESLRFDLDVHVQDSFLGNNFLIGQDFDATLARSSIGFPVFVVAGETCFVSVTNRGDSTGAYHLNLAPFVRATDDFPEFIDDLAVPIVEVAPTVTVTGQITNDVFFSDIDVIQIAAPADSLLRVSTTTADVFVDVIVRSPDGSLQFFFANSFASQIISIAADDQVFLQVSSFFDIPYDVTLRTVVTDGRHDTFNTAARTDDPPGDDSEQIAQTEDAFDITGQLETTDDLDFFSFVAPFTGELVISAPGNSGGFNADSLVFDVSVYDQFFDPFFGDFVGTPFLIGSDANGEAVRSANGLSIFVFEGNRYFVSVANDSDSTGAYQLNLEPVTDGFANSFAEALDITDSFGLSNSAAFENELQSAFDADFFSFVAPQTGGMSIQLSPGTNALGQTSSLVAFLDVYSDDNFSSFLTGDFAFNSTVTTDFSVVAGQTYFFALFNSDFAAASYEISIQSFEVTDDVPADGQDILDFSSANPTELSGSIESRGDSDTYRLTADATQTLQISLAAADASFLDPTLTVRFFNADRTPVLNADGSPKVSFNDDFGFSPNSFLSVPVTEGQIIEIEARGFGGTSRGDYELTISSGDSLKLNEAVPGSIEIPFGTDIYQFTAMANGVAAIAVNAANSALDPIVTITNASTSTFVAFDDDSGPGLNSLVTFGVVSGQSYSVSVGGYGTSTGAYEVRLTSASGNVDDVGDTFGQAKLLTLQDGSLFEEGKLSEGGGDVDVFSFIATFSGTLSLTTSSLSEGLQTGLSVFQAATTGDNGDDFELIAVSDPPKPGVNTTNLFLPVDEGSTYFVRVAGLQNPGAPTFGSYTLRANATSDQIPAAPPPPNQVIRLIDGIAEVSGQIDFETDRDWYRIVAPSSGYFTIDLEREINEGTTPSDPVLDPLLTVYDERQLFEGTEPQQFAIARNDDNRVTTLDSRLRIQAREPGEVFYVEAAGVLDSTGGYRLSVSFEPSNVMADIGDDPSEAFPIELSSDSRTTNLQGSLELAQDQDFYSFTADANATVRLATATALPAGAEVRVFQVGGASLAEVSIDTLTQIGSSSQNIEFEVLSQTSYLIAVVQTGETQSLPIAYDLNLTLSPSKSADLSELESAAQAALLSIADDAALEGDSDPDALRNAALAAAEKLRGTGLTYLVLVIDPVNEFRVTDSDQRQTGLNNGTISGIPGDYISGGTFAQVVILPLAPGESVNLSLAGIGTNLGQSFSAFMVGPSGSLEASQQVKTDTTSNRGDGKANFVVQLGFGDSSANVIPSRSADLSGQSPSFFITNNVDSKDRQTPSTATIQRNIEDSIVLQLEESLPRENDREDPFNPLDPSDWRTVFEGVLQELQLEGLSRPSFDRVLQRLRENDSKLPVELLKNSAVVRSTKAMYEILKNSTGWFRNTTPTTPAPKQRKPMPVPKSATQTATPPKYVPEVRAGSTKATHLGG